MAAYVCADLHLGHRNIHTYRRGPDGQVFAGPEEHDAFVVQQWEALRLKTRRDTVYVVGDVAFSAAAWDLFDSLPGRKVVILGNHCTEHTTIQKIAELKTVNSVHGMLKYKGMWITHSPMHPDHLRGKRNLHGHLHSHVVQDRRYFNCSLEQLGMQPVNMDEVFDEFERRQSLMYVQRNLGWKAAARALFNG